MDYLRKSKISDEKYAADVSERRLLFNSGINGGSYPEEIKRISFILEKGTSRWMITYYGDATNLPDNQIGWQTYRNDEHGFEIKYLPKWMVRTKEFGIVEFILSPIRR